MFLLDTNILSELKRPSPNGGLMKWFEEVPQDSLFLSVITLGEIRKGIELKKLKEPLFKAEIYEEWLHQLRTLYTERILIVDKAVMDIWGTLMATNPNHAIDAIIAATAIAHNLTLVTRNTKDFRFESLNLSNPFL